jgi:DNA-binding NtrC family response regulator
MDKTALGIPEISAAQPSGGNASPTATGDGSIPTLAEIEKRHILLAVDHCKGNRTQAAKALGVSIRTLRNKLHEYHGTQPGADADESEVAEKQD